MEHASSIRQDWKWAMRFWRWNKSVGMHDKTSLRVGETTAIVLEIKRDFGPLNHNRLQKVRNSAEDIYYGFYCSNEISPKIGSQRQLDTNLCTDQINTAYNNQPKWECSDYCTFKPFILRDFEPLLSWCIQTKDFNLDSEHWHNYSRLDLYNGEIVSFSYFGSILL